MDEKRLLRLLESQPKMLRYSFHWPDRVLDQWELQPRRLNFQITTACNHECVSCDHRKRDPRELTTEEWLGVIRALPTDGVEIINFTGGEPLTRRDLPELLSAARDHNVRAIGLNSNATMLRTAALADELIAAGLSYATISYHGVGTHGGFTGKDWAEERVEEGIHLLQEAAARAGTKLDIVIGTLLMDLTWDRLEGVLAFCEAEGLTLLPQLPDVSLPAFATTPVMKRRVVDRKRIDQLATTLEGWIRDRRALALWPRNVAFIRRYLAGDRIEAPCPLGFESVYVDCTGNVYPGCWLLGPVGSVREAPLGEIMATPGYRARVRDVFNRRCTGCSCGYRAMSAYYLPFALETEAEQLLA